MSPNKFNSQKIIEGDKTHDFDKWSRDGKMDRTETEEILKNWRKL